MPDPKVPKSRRRSEEPPGGPVPSEQESDRGPEATDEDVDRGSGSARQEGVESVPREGEVGETGGRSAAPASQARQIDERQRIRETQHHGKS